MQITVKSVRIIKEGVQTRSGNPYKWISVMAEDGSEKGTEYTTFDLTAQRMGAGSIIEIGEMGEKGNIQTKGGKLSFKKIIEIISEVTAPLEQRVPGPSNGSREGVRSSMTPDDWARKDRIERISFETQSGFKGIVEIAVAYIAVGIDPIANDDFKDTYKDALEWAKKHFAIDLKEVLASMPHIGATPEAIKQAKKDTEELWPEAGGQTFKNPGEFFTYCQNKGVTRARVLELLGLKEKDDFSKINYSDAVPIINEEVRAKEKATATS